MNLALGSLTHLATLRTFQLLGEKSWLSGPGISWDDANICKLYDYSENILISDVSTNNSDIIPYSDIEGMFKKQNL